MRYFLDAEFNGFQGQLISLALVPEADHAVMTATTSRSRAAPISP